MDILCGEYGKKMYIYYGDGEGSISGGGAITDADGSQEFGYDRFNGPALVDMNGDGLKDLLVANSNSGTYVNGTDDPGPLRYYENVGKVGEPLFKFVRNITDTTGTELRHVYFRIQVADMDSDGLMDLISANTRDKDAEDTLSRIMIYRNCGTKTEPRFEPGIVVGINNPENKMYAIRLGVSDFNNDGVQDLFINSTHEYRGKLSVFYGTLGDVGVISSYSVNQKPEIFTLSGSTLTLQEGSALSIVNSKGQVLWDKQGVSQAVDLRQCDLAPGVHFLKAQHGVDQQVRKISITQ